MIKYSAFYPDYTAAGVEGTALSTTRNVNRGDWASIANGTALNIGDTLQYFGSTFVVVSPHIKGAGTAAPDVNTNYQIFAQKGGDGSTLYTWIAYADSANGVTGFTTGAPGALTYIGIASNKTSATESTNPADYVWSKMQGPQGPSIVITPSQAGFIYIDGALSPPSQDIIFTATYNGVSGPATWSTNPSIGKNGHVGNSFAVNQVEMGSNSQIVVTATVGTLSQSQLLQKIADPLSDQTSVNVALGIPLQAVTATNSDFAVVTGPTRPADYAGTSVSFIPANANARVAGNSVSLISGNGWITGATSSEFFVGAASISARPILNTVGETMIGLTDVTIGSGPNNYAQLNYCFYTVSGNLYIYESGTNIQAQGAFNSSTQLQIVYDGVTVKYYINSVLARQVGTVNGRTFKAGVALGSGAGHGFRDIIFGAWTMNNWNSIGGPNRPADNADVTGSNTSLNTANVGSQTAAQLVADASAAKGDATIAKKFATDVADNSKFSPEEKKRYVGKVNEWVTSVPALVAKLNAFGLTTIANQLQTAWDSGVTGTNGGFLQYLRLNDYDQLTTKDGIDRGLFQSKARAFSDALTSAANALDQRASETANANSGIYDTFNGYEVLGRGEIRTPLGNSAGFYNQGTLATRSRVVSSLLDQGEITNIVPDSAYNDPEFWNFSSNNAQFIDALDTANWEQARGLYLIPNNGDFDFTSDYFTLEVGATYRVRTRIWNSDANGQTWTGALWAMIHMPQTAWWSLKHGGGINPDIADASNAIVTKQDTGNITHYFRCLSNSMRQIQFRFKSTGRGSNVVVQVQITKVPSVGRDVMQDGSSVPYTTAALQTDQGNSAGFLNQGNLATMNRSALKFGDNSVVDSDFTGGLNAYSAFPYATVQGLPCTVGSNLPQWFGYRNVAYANVVGVLGAGLNFDWLCTKGPWNGGTLNDLKRHSMPVKSGDRVYFRCLLGRHRCVAQLYLMIYNKDGTLIGAPVEQGGRLYGGEQGNPANYDVVGSYFDITYWDAAYAGLMWRMQGTGETDPYIFMTEPAMGVIGSDQTALPPYKRGLTEVNPDMTHSRGRVTNPRIYNTQAIIGARSTTNLSPTYSAPGSSYTVTLPAHNRVIAGIDGPVTLVYGSGSGVVAASTYWTAYIDDPDQTGFASPTINFTSNPDNLLYPGRYQVASGVTPSASGTGGGTGTGGGGGGGFDNCVEAESYMPDGRYAYEYVAGDSILVIDEDTYTSANYAKVTNNKVVESYCAEIETISGIKVVASVTTPITLFGGSVVSITKSLGCLVAVQDEGEFRWEQITSVKLVGRMKVAHISCNNGTYAAGKQPNRYIFTHNVINKP